MEVGAGVFERCCILGDVAVKAGVRAVKAYRIKRSYRVFWSGGENAKCAAEAFAKSTSRTTLEMSELGRQTIKATEGMIWEDGAEAIWREASKTYAQAAINSGQKIAHVFLHEPLRSGALWLTTESKMLMSAGIKIITHFV